MQHRSRGHVLALAEVYLLQPRPKHARDQLHVRIRDGAAATDV
jgi:hypothetical protein